VEQASQLVRYQVLPDNKLLGRASAPVPQAARSVGRGRPGSRGGDVQAGLPVALELDGQPVDLKPRSVGTDHPMEAGVAADKTATVAVDANLTPSYASRAWHARSCVGCRISQAEWAGHC